MEINNFCPCCGSNQVNTTPAVMMPFVAYRAFGFIPVNITTDWNLRTIKTGNTYQPCNTVICKECSLQFCDIRFSEQELYNIYKGYRDDVYTEQREKYEPGYTDRNLVLNQGINYIDKIERFLLPYIDAKTKILDWGGDTGINTPFRNKCSVFVYDVSGKQVLPGVKFVDNSTLNDNKYGLVICSNVLEHVSYPAKVLSELRTCMQNDTVLYIEVPNEVEQDTIRKSWHEHINYFTAHSLYMLLQNNGFEIIELTTTDVSVVNITSKIYMIACKLN